MPALEQPLTNLHFVDEQDPALPDFVKTLGGPYFRLYVLPKACDEDCSIPMAIQVWGLPPNSELAALPREQHITFFVDTENSRQAVRCQLKKGRIFCKRVSIYEEKNADGNPLFFKCSLKPFSDEFQNEIKLDESYKPLRTYLTKYIAFGMITQRQADKSMLLFRQFCGTNLDVIDPPKSLMTQIRRKEFEFTGAMMEFSSKDSRSLLLRHKATLSKQWQKVFSKMKMPPIIELHITECSSIFKWYPQPENNIVETSLVYDFINDRLLKSLEKVGNTAEVPEVARELPGPYFKLTGTDKFYSPNFYLTAIQVQGLPPCPELKALPRHQRVTIFFEASSQVGVVNSEVRRGKLHSKRSVYLRAYPDESTWLEFAMKPPSQKKILDLYSGKKIEDSETFDPSHELVGLMIKNKVNNCLSLTLNYNSSAMAFTTSTNGIYNFLLRGPSTSCSYKEGSFFKFGASPDETYVKQNVTQEGIKFSELDDSLTWTI